MSDFGYFPGGETTHVATCPACPHEVGLPDGWTVEHVSRDEHIANPPTDHENGDQL